MKKFSIHEFKPTIFFLVKFIGLYLTGNLLYGVYVTHYYPEPDPATRLVSSQTSWVLSTCGWPAITMDKPNNPITQLIFNRHAVLDVYEGCNGINTMIIFSAFIFSFGPLTKKLLWFAPLGLAIIHVVNLIRIGALFFIVEYRPDYAYFMHKYIFTAVLYLVILILWLWWAKKRTAQTK